MSNMRAALLILSLLSILPPASPSQAVNIIFVSPPGEIWTDAEQARAIGAVRDAAAWWTRNSKVAVPTFVVGWTATITPTDFSYSLFAWEQPYYSYPPSSLTVFVIDNSSSHRTMAGAVGWAQVPCRAITVLLGTSPDTLAAVIAHEYGHAVLDLDHAPVAAFDIMAPAPPLAAYKANAIGYYTRVALGEPFQKIYMPIFFAPKSA